MIDSCLTRGTLQELQSRSFFIPIISLSLNIFLYSAVLEYTWFFLCNKIIIISGAPGQYLTASNNEKQEHGHAIFKLMKQAAPSL